MNFLTENDLTVENFIPNLFNVFKKLRSHLTPKINTNAQPKF